MNSAYQSQEHADQPAIEAGLVCDTSIKNALPELLSGFDEGYVVMSCRDRSSQGTADHETLEVRQISIMLARVIPSEPSVGDI